METLFKVDSRGLSVDVENYCSDPTTPCTIKTRACGFGAGIFISCGNKLYICRHVDRIEYRKGIFMHMCCVNRNTFGVRPLAFIFCTCPWACTWHLIMNTRKHRVERNFKVDKNTTLLLWSSLPNIPWTRGLYGPTRGWQRSVVTSLSLTSSVLNHDHTITTRRPGPRWACHYPGHNTNIAPVLFLYIYAQGASSGAWAVKVYFWMYSLHSERVAVGARQLWRQRVIVARQPDRPKMAELTRTGEQARLRLAVPGKLSHLGVPAAHLMRIIYPTDTTIRCNSWQKKKKKRESTKGQGEERGSEIWSGECESFCLSTETSSFRRDSHQAILAITYSSTKK